MCLYPSANKCSGTDVEKKEVKAWKDYSSMS
jgi:hypothetical protein